MGRVPGIAGGRGVGGSELGGHRLAQNQGACFSEAGYACGIVVGDEIGVYLGTRGGLEAGGVEDVLGANGDTMQRTPRSLPLF